jgi:hypothetical protein
MNGEHLAVPMEESQPYDDSRVSLGGTNTKARNILTLGSLSREERGDRVIIKKLNAFVLDRIGKD